MPYGAMTHASWCVILLLCSAACAWYIIVWLGQCVQTVTVRLGSPDISDGKPLRRMRPRKRPVGGKRIILMGCLAAYFTLAAYRSEEGAWAMVPTWLLVLTADIHNELDIARIAGRPATSMVRDRIWRTLEKYPDREKLASSLWIETAPAGDVLMWDPSHYPNKRLWEQTVVVAFPQSTIDTIVLGAGAFEQPMEIVERDGVRLVSTKLSRRDVGDYLQARVQVVAFPPHGESRLLCEAIVLQRR